MKEKCLVCGEKRFFECDNKLGLVMRKCKLCGFIKEIYQYGRNDWEIENYFERGLKKKW